MQSSEGRIERRIHDFWRQRVEDRAGPYAAKIFWDNEKTLPRLFSEILQESKPHKTAPGKYSVDVDENNDGETAFQRALISHTGRFSIELRDGRKAKVAWVDVELPVSFSAARSRRRNVDLIAQSPELGTFICELKYKAPHSETGCAAVGGDYAIFEALAYYAFVRRNASALEKHEVRRDRSNPTFSWHDVVSSKRVLVLANERFWDRARADEDYRTRLRRLCAEAKAECGVEVHICSVENCPFVAAPCGKAGRSIKTFGHNRDLVFTDVLD